MTVCVASGPSASGAAHAQKHQRKANRFPIDAAKPTALQSKNGNVNTDFALPRKRGRPPLNRTPSVNSSESRSTKENSPKDLSSSSQNGFVEPLPRKRGRPRKTPESSSSSSKENSPKELVLPRLESPTSPERKRLRPASNGQKNGVVDHAKPTRSSPRKTEEIYYNEDALYSFIPSDRNRVLRQSNSFPKPIRSSPRNIEPVSYKEEEVEDNLPSTKPLQKRSLGPTSSRHLSLRTPKKYSSTLNHLNVEKETIDVVELWQREKQRLSDKSGLGMGPIFRSRSHSLLRETRRTRRKLYPDEDETIIQSAVRQLKVNHLKNALAHILCMDLISILDSSLAPGVTTVPVEVFFVQFLHSPFGQELESKVLNLGTRFVSTSCPGSTKETAEFIEISIRNDGNIERLRSGYVIMKAQVERIPEAMTARRARARDTCSAVKGTGIENEKATCIGVYKLLENKDGEMKINYLRSKYNLKLADEGDLQPMCKRGWMGDENKLAIVINAIKARQTSVNLPHLSLRVSNEYSSDDPESPEKHRATEEKCASRSGPSYSTGDGDFLLKFVALRDDDEEAVLCESKSISSPFDATKVFSTVKKLVRYLTCTTNLHFLAKLPSDDSNNDVTVIEVSTKDSRKDIVNCAPVSPRKHGKDDEPRVTHSLRQYWKDSTVLPKRLESGLIIQEWYSQSFNRHYYEPVRGLEVDRCCYVPRACTRWKQYLMVAEMNKFSDVSAHEKDFFGLWTRFVHDNSMVDNSLRELWRLLKMFRETVYEKRIVGNPGLIRMWMHHVSKLTKSERITRRMEFALLSGNLDLVPEMEENCRDMVPGAEDEMDSGCSTSSVSTSSSSNSERSQRQRQSNSSSSCASPRRNRRSETNNGSPRKGLRK